MQTEPSIKLYNVTHSSVTVEKSLRMGRPVWEAEGDVVPKLIQNPAAYPPQDYLIAVYDEGNRHDEKAEAWKNGLLHELNLTDGITVRPVLAGYSVPKPYSPDIWLLDYRHFGP